MRIFKGLELVGQLGTGIARIFKVHSEEVFEFYPNFIRVNLNFEGAKGSLYDVLNDTKNEIL